MEISRRPLYNSLRMNWILDPTLEVAPWQVEDYRSLPVDVLFSRLQDVDLYLDKISFRAFSDSVDTPETLTDELLIDFQGDVQTRDRVYLIIFELWRRLLPEKTCLSIFCDELDRQIYLYDRMQIETEEDIQDALDNLQDILDENVDNGASPQEAFEWIQKGCANDIELFLRDYIFEQIDNENYLYANDLLDGFKSYFSDAKWVEFLRARVMEHTDAREANRIVSHLIKKEYDNLDIELSLESLTFLVRSGERPTFDILVKKIMELLQIEDDFQSLISLSAEFFHRLDKDKTEEALLKLLKLREPRDLDEPFNPRDPHLTEFFKIISD